MGKVTFTPEQQGTRWRYDDGSESAASWYGVTDAPVAVPTNTNIRLRFLIQETGGGSSSNQDFLVKYSLNGGSQVTITNSSTAITLHDTSNLTNGNDTTQQIGSGTFITSNACVVDNDADGVFGDVTFSGNDEVEIELCINVTGTQGDEYQFEVFLGDGTSITAPNDAYLVIAGNGAEYTTIAAEETQTTIGVSAGSGTVPQISGGTDQFYALAVALNSGSISVSSVSGGSLTWTLRKRQVSGRGIEAIEVWTAHGSPSAFSASITLSGTANTMTATLTRYSGVDQTTPIEDAVGQNTNGENGASTGGTDDTSPLLTTGSTSADSVHYAALACRDIHISTRDTDYLRRITHRMDDDIAADRADSYVEDNFTASTGDDLYNPTLSSNEDWATAGFVIIPASSNITISCSAGVLASAGQTATVAPGEVTIVTVTETLASVGPAATISNVTTVAVTAGVIASSGQAATIVPGEATIAISAGVISSAGQIATIIPGAVSIATITGALVIAGLTVTVGNIVTVQATTGALSIAGQTASILAGEVNISVSPAVLTGGGQSAAILAGAVAIASSTGAIIASGQTVSIVPGVIIVTLTAPGLLTIAGEVVSVTPGAAIIAAIAGALVANGQTAVIVNSGGLAIYASYISNSADIETLTNNADIDNLLNNADITLPDTLANVALPVSIADVETLNFETDRP